MVRMIKLASVQISRTHLKKISGHSGTYIPVLIRTLGGGERGGPASLAFKVVVKGKTVSKADGK